MPVHKLTASFNAGELSPLMDSRVNVEKYDAGCRKLHNFLLHTHGPIFRRPGTEYMGDAADPDGKFRLLAFNFSATTRFVIEMSAGKFRFWSNGELVTKELAGSTVEVTAPHPYAQDELFEVQMKQVNDVCYFAHPKHHPIKLIRKADDDWTCENAPLRYPPLLDEYVEKESVATPTVTEVYNVPLQEAVEATFGQRTPGTIPTFSVNARASTLASPAQWFTVGWTWPSTPGTPFKTLTLQVLRPRDSTWVSVGNLALSTTGTAPASQQLQFRTVNNTALYADLKSGAGSWGLFATLSGFFAANTPAGSVPNLTFRLVYGPVSTNDLAGHFADVTDWQSNTASTNLVHVVQTVASKDIATTWTIPSAVGIGKTLSWQILGSSSWSSLYSWTLYTGLTASTFRLRYTAATTLVLEEKQANGSWLVRGTVTIAAAVSWKLRLLFGPETAQGVSVTSTITCATTNTSTSITMASTSGRSVGETVVGAGIPAGATVASITNGTTLVISVAATATSGSVSLKFTRDMRVVLSDGSTTHTAICQRMPSGPGLDFGTGGITIPKGKWQTRLSVPANATVPAGASVSLQKWNASAWVTVTSWALTPGIVKEYKGLNPPIELTADTVMRFLYKGGASLAKCSAGGAVIETVTYSTATGVTLSVSDTIGNGRTMTARDTADTPAPVKMFRTSHVGSFWQIAHRRELSYSELVGVVGSFTVFVSDPIRVAGRWDVTTYGTWTGTLYLERKTASNIWQVVRTWKSKGDRNVTASGTEEQDVDMRLRVSSGTTGAAASGAAVPRFILEAADSRTYGLVKITEVSPSPGEDATDACTVDVIRTIGEANSPTVLWAEGAWSDYRGFPAAVGLHEARLWFAGSRHQPQTLWASVSNDFENFRRSTLDDGAIAITLAAENSNSIRWINSAQALLIGTGGEEWALRSATEGAAITPTSLRVERQSGYSSMALSAKMIHEVTIFVQRDGQRVRQMTYQDTQQGYTAADLTVLAPHVTAGGVLQIDFQQAPTAILWVVTAKGKLAAMTFEREQNVFGWHLHDTDGDIETLCVLHGTPADEVWVGVKRTIDGVTKRYVERMQPQAMAGDWDTPETLVYADSAKTFTFETPTSALTGLEHLEGKTCVVLVDGTVHRRMAVQNGAIALDVPARVAIVGLPYTSEVQPMKQEVQMQDGTAQGRRFKLHGVTVRVDHSAAGEVSANPQDASLPWSRLPSTQSFGQATPLFTGERDVILESRHEAAVNLTVRQTDPLPLNITALILKFDIYND